MKKMFVDFVLGAAVIMLMGYLFDGVYIKDFSAAFLAAIVLALLNTFVKPILSFIALPITFMTLGLFKLIINAFILSLATRLLAPDFTIYSFGLTLVCSICISILYSIFGIGKDDD